MNNITDFYEAGIRVRNDRFRRGSGSGTTGENRMMISNAISNLGEAELVSVVQSVRQFNDFAQDDTLHNCGRVPFSAQNGQAQDLFFQIHAREGELAQPVCINVCFVEEAFGDPTTDRIAS